MAHKKRHGGAPVPPGNQSHVGPDASGPGGQQEHLEDSRGAPFTDQDPQRRLGNYEGAGEHSFQQPGGKNDANR